MLKLWRCEAVLSALNIREDALRGVSVCYFAGLVIVGSVRQDEGGAAQRAAARVRRLHEVQTAGQDHKVVCGDGNGPADVPAGQTHDSHGHGFC